MAIYTIIYQEHAIQKAFVEISAVKVYFVWNEEKLAGWYLELSQFDAKIVWNSSCLKRLQT